MLENNSEEHWRMENLVHRFTDLMNIFFRKIKEGYLAHVCFGNPQLKKYFPNENFYHGEHRFNIISDLTWYDSEQVTEDLISALKYNQMNYIVENLGLPLKCW